MSVKPGKRRIATLQDPTLEAIAEGLFRFGAESQAVSLLQRLSEQFLIAKDQEPVPPGGCPTLKIWIRGFGLSEEEKLKGYLGHFARISVKKISGGKITLVAAKLPVEMKLHPQKKRPKYRHPNSGHPVIRGAQRGKSFALIEEARVALLKLHEEFPEVSIPGRDKLHVIIYSRQSRPPVKKITLRIAANADGTFKIEVSDNLRKELPPVAPLPGIEPSSQGDSPPAPATGKFATMVALQRRKKPVAKKKPATKKKKTKDD